MRVRIILEQIKELQSSQLQKQYTEVKRKYIKMKEQLLSTKKRFREFEELVIANNEQKKNNEERYHVLINNHRQMNSYIEQLEQKVKHFQGRYKHNTSSSSNSLSRESLSSSPHFIDELKIINLSVYGLISIFSN